MLNLNNVNIDKSGVMRGIIFGPYYLIDGGAVVLSMMGAAINSVAILYPYVGDTLKIEQSRDGGTTWAIVSGGGAVTAADTDFVFASACSHIKITRTGGSSALSYFTLCG